MRLLLDHCVDRRLASHLTPHQVATAAELGWQQLRNGHLLAAAGSAGFDALLTTDKGLRHQQNTRALPVSVLILRARSNRLADLVPLVPRVHRALESLASLPPRQLVEIGGDEASPPSGQ